MMFKGFNALVFIFLFLYIIIRYIGLAFFEKSNYNTSTGVCVIIL